MEAGSATASRRALPLWALGAVPLALLAVGAAVLALLGGPGLGERNGLPVEEIAIERTTLRPGEIQLELRKAKDAAVYPLHVAPHDRLESRLQLAHVVGLDEIVVGSGLEFEERGVETLKGAPGEWRLFAIESPPA